MDERKLKNLFQKYIQKTISETEKLEFFDLLSDSGSLELLSAFSKDIDIPDDFLLEMPSDATQRVWNNILPKKMEDPTKLFLLSKVRWSRVAALILVFLMITGGYKYFSTRKQKVLVAKVTVGDKIIKDAMPGHSGAILKLSNGESFVLDTAQNGSLTQGIVKSSKELHITGANDSSYATLLTPFGRQQKLKLNDGTIVWLNAGSSIRFPLVFNNNKRVVQITGEAYFEVVHNSKKPFIVKVGNEEIQDIGTHFEVNAYSNESSIKTTLLEGSIKVQKQVLKPGQQYINGKVSTVNAEATVAWVSGYFQFEHADIQTVMRQLSRWYNVEVSYEGTPASQLFGGEIQRSLRLSQVLELLAGTGIHYTLDGSKLIIRP